MPGTRSLTTRPIFVLAVALSAAPHLAAQGTITTFAGTEWVFGGDGKPALSAPLGDVDSVTLDPGGNLVFADPDNAIVARLNRDRSLTVLAGNGLQGYSGDGGPAISASLFSPQGVAYDSKGNLYIADQINCRVRRVDPNGVITTVAGTGVAGFTGNGGPAVDATIYEPTALAIDSSDNIYFSDNLNTVIRKIDTNGTISLVAGNPQATYYGEGVAATQASLGDIEDIAAAPKGVLYLADSAYHVIRKIDTNTGIITTAAGTPLQPGYGGDNGPATQALLNSPAGVAVDSAGNIYISDTNNFVIRKIDGNGTITTFAGSGKYGFSPDGPAGSAQFRSIFGLVVDAANNLYVADADNHRVRRITNGTVLTVAGNGIDGVGTFRFIPDQTPASNAFLFEPFGISFDFNGNLLVADSSNNRIRKISPGGAVSTIAGNGGNEFSGDTGPAVSAGIAGPTDVVASKSGSIYIADSGNDRIRRIAPNGVITTVAGNGNQGYNGDGGAAVQSSLYHPFQVLVDSAEDLYIADTYNNLVRKVSGGIISTIAGNLKETYAGDNGPATSASLNWPTGLALDAAANNLYIADYLNGRIRKVALAGGTITTIAGGGTQAVTAGSSLAPLQAKIGRPYGLLLDGNGNLYVSNMVTNPSANQVYRISLALNTITLVAGNGAQGFTGDGGPATLASLNFPSGLALDSTGSLFIADTVNNRIRQILVAPVTLQTSPSSLTFSAKSDGPLTDAQSIQVSTQIAGTPGPAVPYTLATSTTDGGNWLSANVGTNSTSPNTSALAATTPSNVQAFVDPSNLTAGKTYQGSITITAPGATPPVTTLNVSVTLDPPVTPVLGLSAPGLDPTKVQGNTISGALTASVIQAGQPVSENLGVLNTGGGTLTFSATATTANGVNWLSVSTPGGNTATPVQPGSVAVETDPTGLAPGTYIGAVSVTAGTAGTLQAAVILTVTKPQNPHLLLSQVGLTFTAVAGAGAPLDQTFAVLNAGQGTLHWTVQAKTLGGGNGWLLVTPATGSGGASDASSSVVPVVDVAVNPANLNPGPYYAQIQIVSADADNSPQTVTVLLNVLAPGSADPGPEVSPTGLVFTGAAGSVPGSQTVFISNLSANPITYSSSLSTADGAHWFVAAPTNATLATTQPGQPSRVLVQPDFTNLAPGIYTGTLKLNFGAVVRTVTITAAVGGGAGGSGAEGTLQARATPACVGALTVTITSPAQGFSWPANNLPPLQATVFDSCKNVITPNSGDGSGSPDIKAFIQIDGQSQTPVNLNWNNGIWEHDWPVPSITSAADVAVGVQATLSLKSGTVTDLGQATAASGTLTPPPPATLPTPKVSSAVQNAASLVSTPLVAPGSLISMFGQNLADTTSPDACLSAPMTPPLPTQVAGAQIYLGNSPLAILYACDTQINVQVPYDLTDLDIAGAGLWMQLTANQVTAQSVQVSVSTASTQPGIFTVSSNGQGQGVIFNVAADGTTALNGPGAAAGPGDTVIIYCTGLGAVAPDVGLGAPAPSAPPAQTQLPVQVTIGGQAATLASPPQLVPNSAGVYQVQAIVPQNVTAGDQVPVSLTVFGQPSPPVTMAVHQ